MPGRRLHLDVSDEELARRRAAPTTCQLYSDRMRDVFRKAFNRELEVR